MKKYVVGVDLGGTNTRYALIDNNGHVVEKGNFPTTGHTSADAWATHLVSSISEMAGRNGAKEDISGIGIGAPCANSITGVIEAATELPWPSPIPIQMMIHNLSGLPVAVANDANAAAIGEKIYGAATGMENFIMLTLGTGVGSGIICDGRLLSGSRSFAGELGHVTFGFASDRKCNCGHFGCLQTVASARGIVTTALRLLRERNIPSILSSIPAEKLTAAHVSTAAANGDLLAKETLVYTGRCLGEACATFAAFSDPEAFIFYGGVTKSGRLLLDEAAAEFRRKALHLYADSVKFIYSQLPADDAALLGAAALILETFRNE